MQICIYLLIWLICLLMVLISDTIQLWTVCSLERVLGLEDAVSHATFRPLRLSSRPAQARRPSRFRNRPKFWKLFICESVILAVFRKMSLAIKARLRIYDFKMWDPQSKNQDYKSWNAHLPQNRLYLYIKFHAFKVKHHLTLSKSPHRI